MSRPRVYVQVGLIEALAALVIVAFAVIGFLGFVLAMIEAVRP